MITLYVFYSSSLYSCKYFDMIYEHFIVKRISMMKINDENYDYFIL